MEVGIFQCSIWFSFCCGTQKKICEEFFSPYNNSQWEPKGSGNVKVSANKSAEVIQGLENNDQLMYPEAKSIILKLSRDLMSWCHHTRANEV